MTTDLINFIRARLDEDHATADAAAGDSTARLLSWVEITDDDTDRAEEHIERWSPERVLTEIDAKRRMLEYAIDLEAKALDGNWWNLDYEIPFKILALPYATHPAYRAVWRP